MIFFIPILYFLCYNNKYIDNIAKMEFQEDTYMESLSESIIRDEPKITAATKNFMSVILAESLNPNNEIIVSNADALICARIFLKHLNQMILPDIVEWGRLNKQNETQLGTERIDELTKYKIIKSLSDFSKSKNGKVSTLYGKLFFEWTKCYSHLRELVLSDETSTSISSPEVLPYFLDRFQQSLNKENELSELVWSINMAKVLKERSVKREAQAQQRRIDEEQAKEELKNLIQDSTTDNSNHDGSSNNDNESDVSDP